MKAKKAMVLTFAERCKNILASNWQGQLNTIKADAKGSKQDIYSTKIKYMLKRGKPYIWIPEKDFHNVNTIIDERASLAVTSPFPGPLASLLRLIKKLPARVALTGDIVPLRDEKAQVITEKLRDVIISEQKAISESSYTVSGVLNSSSPGCIYRNESLVELLEECENYVIYKFDMRSCIFIDGNGCNHEVDVEDMGRSKINPTAPFTSKLIDGINQSEARRKALVLFCFCYLDVTAKDAYILSIDQKGFDVLGKVHNPATKYGFGQYEWKEFRFGFEDEVRDIETFCAKLVEMEEEAVEKVSSSTGLA